MRTKNAWWILLALCLLVLWGCEGPEGPAGPAGEDGADGHDGEGFSEYTYVGEMGQACMHCHTTTVASVILTAHSGALEDLADKADDDNPYCLQCHTTGWDSEIAYGETEITTYGPDVNGYDDYWGVEGDEAAARREALAGVQCESCHGPMGPTFNQNHPLMSFGTRLVDGVSVSLCAKCHGGQIDEWATSGHANAAGGDYEELQNEHYAGNSSCAPCHYSEGFIAANDPAYADYEFGEEISFIGCVTCHDPHAGDLGDGNESQLRNVGAVEVMYDAATEPGDAERPRMEGYGPAQTCAQCHHARYDDATVAGQIADGYGHFGPHHSPQMDMFIGAGCYEIEGYEYDSTHSHQGASTACVKCHMVRQTLLHGEMQNHSFHTFTPDIGNCTGCHDEWTDFTERDAFQASVMEKLDELAVLFGYTDWADMDENWDSEAEGVEVWQREAAYAAFFILDDGSMGVHNPDYAMSLLDNAIAYYEANTPVY